MVSVASEWELAIKVGTKKIGLDMPTFSQGIDKAGFDRLGITPLHIHAVAQLQQSDDHKDPFDRLLVAQSLSEPLVLLTTDDKLASYGALVRVVRKRNRAAESLALHPTSLRFSVNQSAGTRPVVKTARSPQWPR